MTLSRRSFLTAAGGALALGACRGGGEDPEVLAERVVMANLPAFVDRGRETLAAFEQRTGVRVDYRDDVPAGAAFLDVHLAALSRGQPIGIDVAVVEDHVAARLAELGAAAPLDAAAVPERRALRPELLDPERVPAADPGRTAALPWALGIVGLAYDPARTGEELRSTGDLFAPPRRGRVLVSSDWRDTLGLVLLDAGATPATATRAQIDAAVRRVGAARRSGQLLGAGGPASIAELASGAAWVAVARAADVVVLRRDRPDLRFVVPDEGGVLRSDELVVPRGSTALRTAAALVGHYYRPPVAARLTADLGWASPVTGVAEELGTYAPELATDPLVVPPEPLLRRLHRVRDLPPDDEVAVAAAFADAVRVG